MVELKPCLYCNHSAATIKRTVRAGLICWYVECPCGLASTPQSVESDAPKAWNPLAETKDTVDGLVAILERIVNEEYMRYHRAYLAAVEHNNSEGVGIRFDYVSYPTLPKWYDEAQALIVKTKESKQ